MAAIAGVNCNGKSEQVAVMLNRMTHRGGDGAKVIESGNATLGATWTTAQEAPTPSTLRRQAAWDGDHPPLPEPAALMREAVPFALAAAIGDALFLARDALGIRPLYYGQADDGALCFASEVKGLLEVTQDIHEFPPGTWYDDQDGFHVFHQMERQVEQHPALTHSADEAAAQVRLRLEYAVTRHIGDDVMGCWLSGGLDSSAIAAMARPHVGTLHTFATGLEGAPDLIHAEQMADFLDSEHHQVVVTLDELLTALSDVIYHLESFDTLLVRSTVTNYLAAQRAADYVGTVFSGEGADELFGGYAYLKELAPDQLAAELIDITQRLHNTALQRVDRSASAYGLVAHVPFLDLGLVEYAMGIPASLKLRREDDITEKWILRQAVADVLPEEVVWRRKAKFWHGAGVEDRLAHHAEEQITDGEFLRERNLPNGWVLKSKEELMYYRIFREHFGELNDLSWMGRTKGPART